MLASRADGPWEHGLPFRGRNWLRQLGAHPRVGLSQGWLRVAGGGSAASSSASGAVVPGGASASAAAPAATAAPGGKLSSPFSTSEALLRSTRTTPTDQSAAANAARSAIGHEFVPGSDGPVIHLPTGRTDAQLRQAMQLYDHVRLMHVTLSDADALLRCYEESRASTSMRHLNNLVFPHEWCYRPMEMTAEWLAVERKGKPRRGTEPWCVWGHEQPTAPPACT